ncbi:MAG TPA: hypothetical protein VMS64_17700 [Candidatus Methylomirabilis sp.]|nr:hypothetical protein [Candidatus Methylomirabilis sp.]
MREGTGMWLRWFPWRFLLKRILRAHGFIDPLGLVARWSQFAQPSEVALPVELLRLGVAFHARGIINTQIQQNLDWIWPYWVQRQYDPLDTAFVPRGFSFTHVNLSHRNWTAIGLPGCAALPIVDPRALVTPFYDGWSVDGWVLRDDGQQLVPGGLPRVTQRLESDTTRLVVRTTCDADGMSLEVEASALLIHDEPVCRIRWSGTADRPAWLAVALRPYNPEGVSFIDEVALDADRRVWDINGVRAVRFSEPIERHVASTYRQGDVAQGLSTRDEVSSVTCKVGMATAAALFRLEPRRTREIAVDVALALDPQVAIPFPGGRRQVSWEESLDRACRLQIPDTHLAFLYEAALRTLILHSPQDVYPGPYTYKRFWFRDAAFILHALLGAGLVTRAETVLDTFPGRQTGAGYFRSQEGEWDSNGEALWILHRFCEVTGSPPKAAWLTSIVKGAQWIQRKRISNQADGLHAGLFPAGFSAEHLGPSDYYYWDTFWGVAGLEAAAALCASCGDADRAATFRAQAQDFMRAIDRSLERSAPIRSYPGISASPYRRMDAGAIGSLAASYPLRLWPADDARILGTVEFLERTSFVRGLFFQEMYHSGLNAYLTLHIAQVLLRAGRPRFANLVRAVANAASPTGQWPEAIHPHTGGGCMGDGQHVWAAAEWVMMVRNMFVREEDGGLVLASGVLDEWLDAERPLSFGPTPTPYGDVTLRIQASREAVTVSWDAAWRRQPGFIVVALPGCAPRYARDAGRSSFVVSRCGLEPSVRRT